MTFAPDINLRAATAADTKAITDLVVFVHDEYDYEFQRDGRDRDLQDIPGNYPPPRNGFWVLEDLTGKIVGCGAIKDMGNDTAELARFYFYPEFRRRGFGKKLLDVLLDFARERDYKRVILESHTDMKEAVDFYKKWGWTEIPVYTGEPPDYSNIAFEYRLDR